MRFSLQIFAFLVFVMIGTSCSDYQKQQNLASEESWESKVVQSGLRYVSQTTRDLSSDVRELQKQLSQSCENLESPSPSSSPQLAWKKVMSQFYRLQSLSVGSLQNSAEVYPLNEIFYANLNKCQIDVKMLNLKNKESLPEVLHPSLKGLMALEYLLFEPTLKTSCNLTAFPRLADWNLRSDLEKKADRCQLALHLSQDLLRTAEKIEASWNPQKAEYTSTLKALHYTRSDNEALKNIVQALASLEKIKDQYLGKPLGLNSLCTNESGKCLNDVPHPFSDFSLQAVLISLQSFSKILLGADTTSPSLSTYLKNKGHAEVMDKMSSALQRALLSTEALDKIQPLKIWVENMNPEECKKTTSEDRREPICAVFRDVETVTDIFKTDVLTLLSLEMATSLPQGDND